MTGAEDIVDPRPPAGTARVAVAVVAIVVLLLGGGVFAAVAFGVTPDAPVQLAAGLPSAPATDASAVRTTEVSRSASRTGADPAWIARTAVLAGLPVPAMRAYADAELALHAQQPSCHLRWNTLAGIGWIESQHGTIGGRTLGEDGRSSQPILGPALDGSGGNAAISGDTGVALATLLSNGSTALASANGAVVAADLNSAGPVAASGQSIDIASTNGLTFADLDATAGDVRVQTAGNLTTNTVDATGSVTLISTGGALQTGVPE